MCRRLAILAAACVVALLAATGVASAAATWRLEQPAPPEGAPFRVPLGAPGDLECFSVNRCLMMVEGNATIPRGIFFYDGVEWRQLSTVCGGPGDTARVTFAGPSEFWTVSEPSRPRSGSGTALCHFKDGVVVGSFSTADSATDPFRQMVSATCNGPDNCLFGGVGSTDGSGQRVGAFHLRWDGTNLRTLYNGQGRGVSDLQTHRGTIFETTHVGRAAENRTDDVDLAQPEDEGPRLIHTVRGTNFRNEPFVAGFRAMTPPDATELLAVDSDGEDLWFGGGGTASGPAAPETGSFQRPPIAARLVGDLAGDSFYQEVALEEGEFGLDDRFNDIASLPGSPDAMAAVTPFSARRNTTAKAKVARISPSGQVDTIRLPVSGSGRGSASRIACPAPEECWMITSAGWLFHLTDGTPHERTTDPAFQRRITFRPNEAAEQFVPDAPPVDDSQLFAPPPEPAPESPLQTPTQNGVARRAPALLRRVRKPVLRGRTLLIRFELVRPATIGVQGLRGKRVVARVKARRLKKGRHTLRLRVSRSRKRFPTALRFTLPNQRRPAADGEADLPDDSITTGGGSDTTTTTGDPAMGTGTGDSLTTGPTGSAAARGRSR